MINFAETTSPLPLETAGVPTASATAGDIIRDDIPASLGRERDIFIREPNRVAAVVLQSGRRIDQAHRQPAGSTCKIRGHREPAGNPNLADFRSPPSRIDAG